MSVEVSWKRAISSPAALQNSSFARSAALRGTDFLVSFHTNSKARRSLVYVVPKQVVHLQLVWWTIVKTIYKLLVYGHTSSQVYIHTYDTWGTINDNQWSCNRNYYDELICNGDKRKMIKLLGMEMTEILIIIGGLMTTFSRFYCRVEIS